MKAPAETLKTLMNVGLKAADPYRKILENLPERSSGGLFILSVGKAASPMAQAAADFYKKDFEGVLYAPKGYAKAVDGFKTLKGTHPIPSPGNVENTRNIMGKVGALGEGDLFLALVSGGTSALLCAPEGVSLEDKIALTEELLKSGQPIDFINKKRKKLSAVKGGKLAGLAAPAQVATLVVSDATGDNPAVVGSGPTVRAGDRPVVVIGADHMLAAVNRKAQLKGISVDNLGQIEGEARVEAQKQAALALDYKGKRPHLILSGGETTVKVTGKGKGGRNTEFALALCQALKGAPGIYGLAIDTDGNDGTGPFAGALVAPETLKRNKNPKKYLKNNDSGGFFKATDGLITTGPTLTNLNDLRMVLIT